MRFKSKSIVLTKIGMSSADNQTTQTYRLYFSSRIVHRNVSLNVNPITIFCVSSFSRSPLRYGRHTFIWIRKGTRAFQKMIESDPPPTSPRKIRKGNIFATSTILALIISLPAIAVTLILHYVIRTDLILTLSASLVVLFLAMGFSYKISKKLARY